MFYRKSKHKLLALKESAHTMVISCLRQADGEKRIEINGAVSEWFKVQTWNVCAGATPPGVRIPPAPIFDPYGSFLLHKRDENPTRQSLV